MAMDVAQIAAWEWDVPSGRVTWSTDPEVLFGFPPGAFGADLRISTVRHPERRGSAVRATARRQAGGTATSGRRGQAIVRV